MPVFALLGKKLGHSFSKGWFTSKFEREGLNECRYINLELDCLDNVRETVLQLDLSGFNVTIPYKTAILPYLDTLSEEAHKIGAVNTVRVQADGTWKGFNTDARGFRQTLKPLLKPCHSNALILGTGGSSRAVAHVLTELGIEYRKVSRAGDGQQVLRYEKLTMLDVRNAPLIINTTPLGMFPAVSQKPDIPYEGVDKYHLMYDLVYNPPLTPFMQMGELYGAAVTNGYDMLIAQAREAWQIWTEKAP